MGAVTIGCDVGQRVDPTAVCVVELEERAVGPVERVQAVSERTGNLILMDAPPRVEAHHIVRHLERLPLDTLYQDVAARLKAICADVQARTKRRPTLYFDATGAVPFLDTLAAAELPATVTPCFFNHGDRRTADGREVKIGKAWLVSQLQVLLQSGRLHLPKTAEAEALAQELLDYEIRIDPDGGDKYGAFKVGKHDDLVTALGLAVPPRPASRQLVTF